MCTVLEILCTTGLNSPPPGHGQQSNTFGLLLEEGVDVEALNYLMHKHHLTPRVGN